MYTIKITEVIPLNSTWKYAIKIYHESIPLDNTWRYAIRIAYEDMPLNSSWMYTITKQSDRFMCSLLLSIIHSRLNKHRLFDTNLSFNFQNALFNTKIMDQ